MSRGSFAQGNEGFTTDAEVIDQIKCQIFRRDPFASWRMGSRRRGDRPQGEKKEHVPNHAGAPHAYALSLHTLHSLTLDDGGCNEISFSKRWKTGIDLVPYQRWEGVKSGCTTLSSSSITSIRYVSES
jgi:hypothetical protein